MSITEDILIATPSIAAEVQSTIEGAKNTTTVIDIVSVIIAILALGASIVSLIWTIQHSKKAQKITLEADYFRTIFKDYLVRKFPKAREKIFFQKNKISGHKEFIDQLNSLRRKLSYFRYTDKQFYENLKTELQKLEDFILSAMNKSYESSEQTDFNISCDSQLSSIYELITKRYYGMK